MATRTISLKYFLFLTVNSLTNHLNLEIIDSAVTIMLFPPILFSFFFFLLCLIARCLIRRWLIRSYFPIGLYFPWGRTLEKLVCDLLSRGAVRIGADLLVHGADIFEFPNQKQIGRFLPFTLSFSFKFRFSWLIAIVLFHLCFRPK